MLYFITFLLGLVIGALIILHTENDEEIDFTDSDNKEEYVSPFDIASDEEIIEKINEEYEKERQEIAFTRMLNNIMVRSYLISNGHPFPSKEIQKLDELIKIDDMFLRNFWKDKNEKS